MNNNKNNYCIIMAGGIGTRFWPMSTAKKPKQFLDILGSGKTLLRQTYERFKRICPPENIMVVTSDKYRKLVREQLGVRPKQIVCEPMRRNTAPCIAYASYKIASINPQANIAVSPSDHIILKDRIFRRIIRVAFNKVSEEDCLITLGVKPERPDTGYGYIQFREEVISARYPKLRKVKTFTEKPSASLAQEFLGSGDFYWNSGIFIWNVQSILRALEKYLPEVNDLFKEGEGRYNQREERTFIHKTYEVCKSISIDYGVMEKADNVYVMLADIGWSDLGTWGSLHEQLKKDERGNSASGKKVMLYDTSNCIVNVPGDKLVVLQGLDDCIVVEANNTLLVCRKKDEQKIRQIVSEVGAKRR